ncbi:1-aminocyclopropane-1-carboxylate deaminase/D-cysteine desulfhydrase [Psychromonas sp. KJ10-10]|uniref:1-aminocyclopropane-1-carboxylate deaminase/D-cysteine desulfhydrase n=1 Tax=Psychromonas sp. KJ10-10 TaxID=3391823 RepID=UPI0039B415D5
MDKSLSQLSQQLQLLISPSPLQELNHPLLQSKNISLSVKRDDLLHADISGNKWRKLKFNLIEARKQGINHLVSFGGAYSNHIHALAAAGHYFGFETSAIIRGEPHYANNPTLKQAQQWGMHLHFVSRQEYRQREEPQYLQRLQDKFPEALIIPEGGSSPFAIPGVMELCDELMQQSVKRIDHIFTATGSGGTLAGLIAGFSNNQQKNSTRITGIAVLKQADYLLTNIDHLLGQANQSSVNDWQLLTQFHGGGYAKVSPELGDFCSQFESECGIPIEPIYTGKMFYALFELIKQDYFNDGDNIVALHTGGLQGLQGLNKPH